MALNRFSVLVSLIVASTLCVQGLALAEHSITAQDVATHTDKETNTSVEIKKYVASLKGQQFTATGRVQDVQQGRSGYKVVVNADMPGRSKRFVVDVIMKDGNKFRKGASVSCRGKIVKVNRFTYRGIGIEGSCS